MAGFPCFCCYCRIHWWCKQFLVDSYLPCHVQGPSLLGWRALFHFSRGAVTPHRTGSFPQSKILRRNWQTFRQHQLFGKSWRGSCEKHSALGCVYVWQGDDLQRFRDLGSVRFWQIWGLEQRSAWSPSSQLKDTQLFKFYLNFYSIQNLIIKYVRLEQVMKDSKNSGMELV